jgi:hypothetical protein
LKGSLKFIPKFGGSASPHRGIGDGSAQRS